MTPNRYRHCLSTVASLAWLAWIAVTPVAAAEVCTGFGPQSPRDIDALAGANGQIFSLAPASTQMNLCNIHFHKHAEHKAASYSVAAEGGAGFRCAEGGGAAEHSGSTAAVCGGVAPGDTIEVHWVYSSCDVAPGSGLGSCLSESCSNPDLRVEAQVFLVADDGAAMDFGDFDVATSETAGYHQPKALPTGTGAPVLYHGSTTGPSYDEAKCSPFQVTWSVRPECATLSASSLGAWCGDNVFDEDHAHGVRTLVGEPSLLSPIAAR